MMKLQKIVLTAAALVCTSVITVVSYTRFKPEEKAETSITIEGVSLSYDADAVEGVPDISDEAPYYGTLSIPLSNGDCRVSMDSAPKLNGDELDVWFTNSAENTVGLRLVVFDESDRIIGSSGIIKNGEYVKSVKLEGKAEVGQQLKTKILTYEAETFYSLGSAGATIITR